MKSQSIHSRVVVGLALDQPADPVRGVGQGVASGRPPASWPGRGWRGSSGGGPRTSSGAAASARSPALVTPELWPTRWTTREAGHVPAGPAGPGARRQKSTSSKYMKYPSSSRPIASKTSRRTIRLAPATQSVRPVASGTGGATTWRSQEPGDRAEPEPPLQLARGPRGTGRPTAAACRRGAPAGSRPGRRRGAAEEVDQAPSAPGRTTVSGLSSQTSPGGPAEARAGAIATLLPAANPPFRGATTSDGPAAPAVLADRRGQPVGRVVARGVLDHHRPGPGRRGDLGLERPQAVDRQPGRPVIDDDDQERGGLGSGPAARSIGPQPSPCLRRPDGEPGPSGRPRRPRSKWSVEGPDQLADPRRPGRPGMIGGLATARRPWPRKIGYSWAADLGAVGHRRRGVVQPPGQLLDRRQGPARRRPGAGSGPRASRAGAAGTARRRPAARRGRGRSGRS